MTVDRRTPEPRNVEPRRLEPRHAVSSRDVPSHVGARALARRPVPA